jgi:hypothetical protein
MDNEHLRKYQKLVTYAMSVFLNDYLQNYSTACTVQYMNTKDSARVKFGK